MKKISILAIAVALLLCLTGCPTVHKDAEWSVLTPGYCSGSITEWAQNDTTKINWTVGAGSATAEVEFTADASGEFKLCDSDWKNAWGKETVPVDTETALSLSEANAKITGLTVGEVYVMKISTDSSTVKVTVVKK
jgi:hypothetical protein